MSQDVSVREVPGPGSFTERPQESRPRVHGNQGKDEDLDCASDIRQGAVPKKSKVDGSRLPWLRVQGAAPAVRSKTSIRSDLRWVGGTIPIAVRERYPIDEIWNLMMDADEEFHQDRLKLFADSKGVDR